MSYGYPLSYGQSCEIAEAMGLNSSYSFLSTLRIAKKLLEGTIRDPEDMEYRLNRLWQKRCGATARFVGSRVYLTSKDGCCIALTPEHDRYH